MTLAASGVESELSKDGSNTVQILTWSSDGKLFGMDVSECREIAKDKKITPVPHSEDTVLGIVNLRGEVVTVLDLSRLLGYQSPGNTENAVLIRLKTGSQQVSIKADQVFDVINALETEFEPAPSNLTEKEARFISSVLLTTNGLAVILNSRELSIP